MKEKKEKLIRLLILLITFILLIFIIFLTPVFNKYHNDGKLIINEVMASNNYTIVDSYGKYSDYIEIYNGYDHDINLLGYYLSDNDYNTKKWSFPNVTIKKNDYILVFASGKNSFENGELHTNFKLKNDGEVVTLSDSSAKSLSKIHYDKIPSDMSYGYNENKYVYYYKGSPLEKNSGDYQDTQIIKKNSNIKLSITEYMVSNLSYKKSNDDNYYGMIELYNDEDYDINLSGYYLSNDRSDISKYSFPDVSIKAKSYLVVYTSLKNSLIDDEIHTNFKLDSKDTVIVFSDNHKNQIDMVNILKSDGNISSGLYNGKWQFYNKPSLGEENTSNYINDMSVDKDIIINEVSTEAVEIKNITSKDINLNSYSLGDKSGYVMKFPDVTIRANGYLVVYTSDNYSYSNGRIYSGFTVNSSNEEIYLYKDNVLINKFYVGKLINGISTGIDSSGKKVLYKKITIGNDNSDNKYVGYSSVPVYSIDGGYVSEGTKIKLTSKDGGTIYYTLDGSFPNKNSAKYVEEIIVNKTMVIKAISYKDNYIESDIVSRTFFVGRKHDIPIVSISTYNSDLFGYNGIISNFNSNMEKKVNFEFYESNGSLGTSFIGGTRLTGMDSRQRDQKSMAIYLRDQYGLKEVSYPFFKNGKNVTYSSFVLRNSGEDPYSIRIQDTVLTYALQGQMDIDMQDYRAVIVYLNGSYYGLYNMREKLNGDYIKSKYGYKDGEFDLLKYTTATSGSTQNYNNLLNYMRTHNVQDSSVYNYLKEQIDFQELCNYLIVESYYGNTDQGNIRYWKGNNGKWRFMLYDLDWSLWNTSVPFNYTVLNTRSPAVTNLYSVYEIARILYRNSEFRDMYLSTFGYHLKNTFNPDRMNDIVDELASEIKSEMPYHISRWNSMYPSMDNWNRNVSSFKSKLTNRYNYVVNNIRSQFNLGDSEYQKYFGGV